jgi:ubiquinone/menaquinone biosynthesis C-methylase UbiE
MSGGAPEAGGAAGVYTLGSDRQERDRLRRQSVDLRDISARALDTIAGLDHRFTGAGWSALDLGCGPAGSLELLSERAGPDGRVVGVDLDPEHVALARRMADSAGLANVEVHEGNARGTPLPSSSFDLVHARLLLVNVPDPAEVAAEMARLARPGGWVTAIEADAIRICHPPLPAWDRLGEVFAATYRSDGADPAIGRRLGELLRGAGLVDVGVEAWAPVYPLGHARRTILPDLVRSMRDKAVDRGIVGAGEYALIDREVRSHLADPATVAIPYLIFTAWGRRPEGRHR